MACLSVSGHKFLGATLTGINTTLGWGSNGTSVDVSLVEDLCKGDNFDPPLVGSPVCGTVGNGGWYFGGFLDSWEFKSSTSAGHTYSVKIVDPTQLLQNYHCVLGNYDGSVFGVPNLANVFGYLEQNFGVGCFDSINGDKSGVNYVPATGWGGAHINSGGIPSTLVLTALDSILNGSGGTFVDRGEGLRPTLDIAVALVSWLIVLYLARAFVYFWLLVLLYIFWSILSSRPLTFPSIDNVVKPVCCDDLTDTL